MDINKIINNIRESKTFQSLIAASVFGIIVYSGVSLFDGGKSTVDNGEKVDEAIIDMKGGDKKSEETLNKKRILEQMRIEYKKANNPNEVYVSPNEASASSNWDIIDYDVKVENKIFQYKKPPLLQNNEDKETEEDKNKTENKEEDDKPKKLTLNTKENKIKEKSDVPIILKPDIIDSDTYKEKMEEKRELYAEILRYINSEGTGDIVIKDSFWDNRDSYKNNKDIVEDKEKSLDNQKNEENIKIIPGSSFLVKLLIPLNSLYGDNVKPVAEILNSPLRGYKIIGQVVPTPTNSGLILRFNRLISPNGNEISVNAVGVQTKGLSPKFADKVDRHIFPRIVLATLATVTDALFNREIRNNYSKPAQSILSEEFQKMMSEYQTEIKVNPQYFVVIFY